MNVTLHKLHGAGNAYLVVNAAAHCSLPAPHVAASACRRRLGLDADGLAYISHLGRRRFDVDVFNADGSESGINGNALRCCARWICQEYGYDSMSLRQGPTVSRVEVEGESVRIRFSVTRPPRPAVAAALPLFTVSVETLDVLVLLPSSAPDGCGSNHAPGGRRALPAEASEQGNLVCVDSVERDRLKVATFEVGVQTETLSSATGALAAVATGQQLGWLSAGHVRVRSLGGELVVCRERQGPDYWVDGPVEHVFSGEYRLPDVS